ncbi:MAG: hypothetical protein JSV12_07915 [Candidatus Bathyarchaeota archaeon]|nr:MAG: hypothetical protein JSV12_07915 [Candidatus Bathyarchaeota archaeon]
MEKKSLIVNVCSAKQRPVAELAGCALCQEVKPLFWKDGKLFCFETKFYAKDSRLFVLDTCVAKMPTYSKTVRVEGFANIPSVILPVVRTSAITEKILEQALNMLKE